jgi:hypothetical protein
LENEFGVFCAKPRSGLFCPQLREQFVKMKQFLTCICVPLVFGCLVASVRADDLYPPPWASQRGQPNTTYQNWTFSTDANPSAPDEGLYNPNGTPMATITGIGNTWYQFYDGENGVWVLSGDDSSMDLGIPNTPVDYAGQKYVWTQISWEPSYNGEAAPVVVVNGIQSAPVTTFATGSGNWFQSVYATTLAYNPNYEDVIITGNYYLAETVVDTMCVPEPSSLALLAVGAIGLLSYASRKRRLAT